MALSCRPRVLCARQAPSALGALTRNGDDPRSGAEPTQHAFGPTAYRQDPEDKGEDRPEDQDEEPARPRERAGERGAKSAVRAGTHDARGVGRQDLRAGLGRDPEYAAAAGAAHASPPMARRRTSACAAGKGHAHAAGKGHTFSAHAAGEGHTLPAAHADMPRARGGELVWRRWLLRTLATPLTRPVPSSRRRREHGGRGGHRPRHDYRAGA